MMNTNADFYLLNHNFIWARAVQHSTVPIRQILAVATNLNTGRRVTHTGIFFMQGLLGDLHNTLYIVGVLSVEHCGKPARKNDGLCLTLLLSTRNILDTPSVLKIPYRWMEVNKQTVDCLNTKLLLNRIVPLILR